MSWTRDCGHTGNVVAFKPVQCCLRKYVFTQGDSWSRPGAFFQLFFPFPHIFVRHSDYYTCLAESFVRHQMEQKKGARRKQGGKGPMQYREQVRLERHQRRKIGETDVWRRMNDIPMEKEGKRAGRCEDEGYGTYPWKRSARVRAKVQLLVKAPDGSCRSRRPRRVRALQLPLSSKLFVAVFYVPSTWRKRNRMKFEHTLECRSIIYENGLKKIPRTIMKKKKKCRVTCDSPNIEP